MRRMALLAAVLGMAACGTTEDGKVECGLKAQAYHFCSGSSDTSYRCPAGSAEDAKTNADIDAACKAEGGTDSAAIAQCMMKAQQDGRYKMGPAEFVEDCAASGKKCDWAALETEATKGRCVEKD